MDPAFMQAVAPKPHSVLGLQLKPLTLGHQFLLAKHNSYFVTGDTKDADLLGLNELMMAVWICSFAMWEDSARTINSITFRFFIWIWGLRVRKMSIEDEREKFLKYWNVWHDIPKVKFEKRRNDDGAIFNVGREVGSPYEWMIMSMLISEFHMNPKDALNTTFVFAGALWASNGERKGDFALRSTPTMEDFDAFCRQRDLEKFGRKN